MQNLADGIEAYLTKLLRDAGGESIIVRRGELAELFACAPSQISYVLQTRFIPRRGYLVETRRGGGGYIRITSLDLSADDLWRQCLEYASLALTQDDAHHLIGLLFQAQLITPREARLMSIAVNRAFLHEELPWRDEMRAQLVRAMLATLMVNREDADNAL